METVSMRCVDCGKEFTAEAIPGPYKRCELCKERHRQWFERLSAKERRQRVEKALRLARKDGIRLLNPYIPTPASGRP